MALVEEFERQGNFLFKYRSYIPLIFLVSAILVFVIEVKAESSVYDDVFNSYYGYFCLCVTLIGLTIRVYTVGFSPDGTSGRNTANQVADVLNSSGIYSLVRHPLYLGNYLMWLGPSLLTYNIWFVCVFSLTYWLYYERIMFAEEQFLRNKFSDSYVKWAEKRPAFILSFKHWEKNKQPFSYKKILKKEKNALAATFICFYLFQIFGSIVVEDSLNFHITFWSISSFATILLYLVLKYLKDKTKVLG